MKKASSTYYIHLITLLFLVFPNTFKGQASSQNDSLSTNFEKYKKHVLTLDYIGRKTNSNPYFLNLAKTYCDSILTTGVDDNWAIAFKEKIDLTIATCEFNMNYKVQLFPYFS